MNIVVVGGGTGTSVILNGLKRYRSLDISVVVNMTDDGGSNAVVRDEFGVLPLSDLRKSLIALADENYNDILRQLFVYRFPEGNSLKGHTLGNLLMLGLVDITGSEIQTVKLLEELFHTKGRILPVTADDVRLVAKYSNGEVVRGEHLIDEVCEDKKIESFGLDNTARISGESHDAILNADYIVVGPGDLYTSLLACIVINGVPEAIEKSNAELIYIGNLMSKIGQTRDMTQSDIVGTIEEYMGRKFDTILLNNGKISDELLEQYREDGEKIISDDMENDSRVKRGDIVANSEYVKERGDNLKRSLVRHDSQKIADILYKEFAGPVKRIWMSLISTFY